jgi:hypothetical protein
VKAPGPVLLVYLILEIKAKWSYSRCVNNYTSKRRDMKGVLNIRQHRREYPKYCTLESAPTTAWQRDLVGVQSFDFHRRSPTYVTGITCVSLSFLGALGRCKCTLLRTFAKFRKREYQFRLPVRPAVYPYGTTRLSQNGFPRNWIFEDFSKIFWEYNMSD